jgi:hypothetical protein
MAVKSETNYFFIWPGEEIGKVLRIKLNLTALRDNRGKDGDRILGNKWKKTMRHTTRCEEISEIIKVDEIQSELLETLRKVIL